jgi:hypothetical protein
MKSRDCARVFQQRLGVPGICSEPYSNLRKEEAMCRDDIVGWGRD